MSASVVHHRLIAATAVFLAAMAAWLLLVPRSAGPFLLTAQTPKVPLRPADLLKVDADLPASVADLYRDLARLYDRLQLASGESIDIVPFEQQALTRIAEFEKAAGELPTLERLKALETALAVALRFSLSVRERPLFSTPLPVGERGRGEGLNRWDPLQADLGRKLLEVRRSLLGVGTTPAREEAQWRDAIHFGDTLLALYPDQPAVLTDVARQRLRYAAFVLLHHEANTPAGKDYAAIRQQLDWVDEHLPQPPRPDVVQALGDVLMQSGRPIVLLYQPDAAALRQLLARKAAALLDRAKQTKDDKKAEQLLQAALEIWPRLPGLRDELLKRQGKYAILYVGVRTLPKYLSPARAVADAELQALELLFEALVQTRPADDGSLVFVPRLAASLPQMVDNERRFLLNKTARWSNGKRVTSADVQKTFELLTSPKLPGHSGELADQLEPIRAGEDAFRVEAKLRQGLLESLSPFTFKVLPRDYGGAPLVAADDETFALAPVGSGPYRPAGTVSEHGRTYVRFVVNPYYGDRTNPAGPKIRELRFFVSQDPAADFAHKTAPLHMLLDVPTQELGKLKAAGVSEIRTLPTRRVYFLAVNNRDPVLADEALRRALAHAINRGQLLADCFGAGRPSFHTAGIAAWGSTLPVMAAAMRPKGAALHHALNGPYPAGSWAACPDGRVPKDLFDRARAETFLLKAKSEKGAGFDLELKYPDDDPRVGEACQAIATQLADLGDRAGRPIKVRLVALSPQQLQRDLLARRYQLAYWHHDFPDNAFALWPLFDPREEATTGSNYLGFKDDGTLTELLQKAGSYRDFQEVKRLTHDIHVVVFERMPLIPLWQLDYHVAVHPDLKLPPIDPLRVFANIEEWQLKGH